MLIIHAAPRSLVAGASWFEHYTCLRVTVSGILVGIQRMCGQRSTHLDCEVIEVGLRVILNSIVRPAYTIEIYVLPYESGDRVNPRGRGRFIFT
ncbi:hypothetical protein KC321_g61 [Hortaea werneckii]|nr:hypothetical protein KC321_g61 [Hortaea werneckii]